MHLRTFETRMESIGRSSSGRCQPHRSMRATWGSIEGRVGSSSPNLHLNCYIHQLLQHGSTIRVFVSWIRFLQFITVHYLNFSSLRIVLTQAIVIITWLRKACLCPKLRAPVPLLSDVCSQMVSFSEQIRVPRKVPSSLTRIARKCVNRIRVLRAPMLI